MMGEATYALAMEPSTGRDAGRSDARQRGELRWLEPGEVRTYDLEIGALAGAAIGAFEEEVSALATPGRGARDDDLATSRVVSHP